MFALRCTRPAIFDVDDTLIKWRPNADEKENYGVECEWPIRALTMDAEGRLVLKEQKEEDSFIRIEANIEQLKEHKRRGHTVIVWSAGGWVWAEMAVKMLGIEDYVDLVLEKPTSLYDDKALEEFMPKVQFMKDPEVIKKDPMKKATGMASLRREMPSFDRAPSEDEESPAYPYETGNSQTAPTRR
jgi:hypothetical protein